MHQPVTEQGPHRTTPRFELCLVGKRLKRRAQYKALFCCDSTVRENDEMSMDSTRVPEWAGPYEVTPDTTLRPLIIHLELHTPLGA